MTLHFKPEVRMAPGLAAAVLIRIIAELFERHGVDVWLTSANDGTHKEGSFHYRDLAWDFRTHHLQPLVKAEVIANLRQRLAPQFQVLFEGEGSANEHLHVQYNPH